MTGLLRGAMLRRIALRSIARVQSQIEALLHLPDLVLRIAQSTLRVDFVLLERGELHFQVGDLGHQVELR